MTRPLTTRPRLSGRADKLKGDRGLRYAAIFFAAGLVIHTADHLRRGTDAVTPQVLWGGMALTVAGVIAIAAVLARHRLAPQVAIAVGLWTALSVSASHLLPRWSSLSDAFPGGDVDALSWAAVLVEIAGAIALAAAAVAMLRRRKESGVTAR